MKYASPTLKLRISEGIFFRTYFDELYLYDTVAQKNYIFNAVAADIIRTIDTHPWIATEDMISKLATEYQVGKDELRKDAITFVNTLVEKGILRQKGMADKRLAGKPAIANPIPFEEQIQHKLQMATGSRGLLLAVLLELTYRCNERCIHCYATEDDSPTDKELSAQEWFSVIDQLLAGNVMFLVLTGGEVRMRDDFLAILTYAIQKRFVVDIFSNGLRFSDEDIFQIASLHPRSFQCSIYGKPETHDSITNVAGSFRKTIHTLSEFHKHGVPIVIKTVMMKENADDYDDICRIAQDLDASLQIGLSISAKNNGSFEPLSHRMELNETMNTVVKKEHERLNYKPAEKEPDMSLCGAGFNTISINPYGEVFPCNSLGIKIGSVKEQTVAEIWRHSQQLEQFRHLNISNLSSCVSCENLNYCQFCPGLALSETGSMFKPYTEACQLAVIRKNIVEKGGIRNEKV